MRMRGSSNNESRYARNPFVTSVPGKPERTRNRNVYPRIMEPRALDVVVPGAELVDEARRFGRIVLSVRGEHDDRGVAIRASCLDTSSDSSPDPAPALLGHDARAGLARQLGTSV